MTGTARNLASIFLVALDLLAGVLIGGIAMGFVMLVLAGTGYGWLFAIALVMVLLSTGLADRLLLPRKSDEPEAAARPWRRVAFVIGLVIGVASVLLRFDILPGGLAP
ncbi:hypothetical protein [Hasllibacter sp. MH4015]|uniref:hypothetical protein n=1 Tax=Hasllibacter sp. MH4015 TaxID=2854029 RepID=UPI001CD2E320|nr:hypothetical protein [Hasllibacter sp. MH4015]